MLITGIKSKPIYTSLKPDVRGRFHVLIGQGSGGKALLGVASQIWEFAPHLHIIYSTVSVSGENHARALQDSKLGKVEIHATITGAIAGLERTLAGCVMGTRLYVAGSEMFIGSALQVANAYNLNADEIQCEHVGTLARRVYCIHCRGYNENVTTNIVQCRRCGRQLLVRDHYSKRLASYMGVMVDAEIPGDLPPVEELYR